MTIKFIKEKVDERGVGYWGHSCPVLLKIEGQESPPKWNICSCLFERDIAGASAFTGGMFNMCVLKLRHYLGVF